MKGDADALFFANDRVAPTSDYLNVTVRNGEGTHGWFDIACVAFTPVQPVRMSLLILLSASQLLRGHLR